MKTKNRITWTRSALGLAIVAVGLLLANQALTIVVAQEPSQVLSSTGKSKDRVREGTELVNVVGSFRLTGDRATFYPADGSGRFGGLENQTLERVATVIGEDPSPMDWLVTGTVTEFKGNNYLLVTRAILKSKPSSLGKPGGKPR